MAERVGARPNRRALAPLAARARRVAAVLRYIALGATGLHAYEQYVAHLRRHHPDQTPMAREAFYRRELAARWDGVRRCC